jgi:hypothetical protein
VLSTDELDCLCLNSVEAIERLFRTAHPDGAGILHHRADVGLVDGSESFGRHNATGTAEIRDSPRCFVSNVVDVGLPVEVVRDGETNNLHLRPLRDRLAIEEEEGRQ